MTGWNPRAMYVKRTKYGGTALNTPIHFVLFLFTGGDIIKNIFISSSSHTDIDKKYIDSVDNITKELSNNFNLNIGIYMEDGMPGKIINNFLNNKRKVTVYTMELYKEDFSNFKGDYKYLDSTFTRTNTIYDESDIILILPGGSGTLGELFSMLEENRTIKTDKEIIIYNINNYYDDLIKFLVKAINNRFNDNTILNYIRVFNDEKSLLKYIERRK